MDINPFHFEQDEQSDSRFFIEGIGELAFGTKPCYSSHLTCMGWAGDVIPPNANIILKLN
jgi:hypothetical protein